MSEMKWHTSMIFARDSSWAEQKPVLLDFHNPESIDCKQMDAATFSQDNIIKFIEEHFIPLRLDYEHHTFAREYNVIWAPTLIVLDRDGKEFQRTIGYLEQDELFGVLLLGVAKAYFHNKKYDAAKLHLEMILEQHSQSDAAPEALYFLGANQYRWKNDPKALRNAYESLLEKYPNSVWVEKASPYKNL